MYNHYYLVRTTLSPPPSIPLVLSAYTAHSVSFLSQYSRKMLTETLQYGKDHVLQTVAVTTLPETSLHDNSYWVM